MAFAAIAQQMLSTGCEGGFFQRVMRVPGT